MINIFRGYVRTKDKKPIQKFKDVDTLLSLEEASEFDEYAGILNDEYVVIESGPDRSKIKFVKNAIQGKVVKEENKSEVKSK